MPGIKLPKPFDGHEHRSFRWQAGAPAALLLHGFPGTPAEMRPLGKVLHEAGWTVHGLMLPGLGADFESLEQRRVEDWSEAASQALQDLTRRHALIMLVGYSMGGALALLTAAERRPAGLVLLAPFWSFEQPWMRLLWPLVQLLFRRVKPLKHADFSATAVRRGLQRMYRNIDLENPQVQEALRQISVPLNPLAQIRQLGLRAFERASQSDVPTLVIQGRHDRVVPPPRTARLIARMPNGVKYREVDAAHDLVDPDGSAWNEIKASLLEFSQSIREPIPSEPGLGFSR